MREEATDLVQAIGLTHDVQIRPVLAGPELELHGSRHAVTSPTRHWSEGTDVSTAPLPDR